MKGEYTLTGPRDMDTIPSPSPRKIVVLKILVTLGVALQLIGPGMVLGFNAMANPEIFINSTCWDTIQSQKQSPLFSSSICLTAIVGILISVWTLKRWGRKVSLLLLNLPGLAGWFAIAFDNYLPVLIGRFVSGIALGMAPAICYVYLSEVAPKPSRDSLRNAVVPSVAFGVVLIYILDWVFCFKMAALVAVTITALALLVAIFLPESPAWLVANARTDDAERALLRLRGGGGPDVRAEFQELVDTHQKRILRESEPSSAPFIEPLFVMLFFFVFQQFSGTYVFLFYTMEITFELEAAAHYITDMRVYIRTVMCGVILFIALSFLAFKSFSNRRKLAIYSGIGMTIFILTIFTFTQLFQNLQYLAIIPRAAMFGLIVSAAEGFIFLPWTMLADVFPEQKRTLGATVAACTGCGLTFVSVYVYPILVRKISFSNVFGIFLVFSMAGSIFVWMCLPGEKPDNVDETVVMSSLTQESEVVTVNNDLA